MSAPIAAALAVIVCLLNSAGCRPVAQDMVTAVQPTSFAERAQRRAFDGAPPVIPHPPLGAACTACHTATGKPAPPVGIAPANPHRNSPRAAAFAVCGQCHVFQPSDGEFALSHFEPLPQRAYRGERLFPGAPPVIPHSLQLRENCTACHAGAAARPEIRCSHPERTNCVQCHVTMRSGSAPLGAEEEPGANYLLHHRIR